MEGHSSEEGGDFGSGEGGSESSAGVDVGRSGGGSSRRDVGRQTGGSIGEDDVDRLDAKGREREGRMSLSDPGETIRR